MKPPATVTQPRTVEMSSEGECMRQKAVVVSVAAIPGVALLGGCSPQEGALAPTSIASRGSSRSQT